MTVKNMGNLESTLRDNTRIFSENSDKINIGNYSSKSTETSILSNDFAYLFEELKNISNYLADMKPDSIYVAREYLSMEQYKETKEYYNFIWIYLSPLMRRNNFDVKTYIYNILLKYEDNDIDISSYSTLYKVKCLCFSIANDEQPLIQISVIRKDQNMIYLPMLRILNPDDSFFDIELTLYFTKSDIDKIKTVISEEITGNNEYMLIETAFLYDLCPDVLDTREINKILNRLVLIRRQNIYAVIVFIKYLYCSCIQQGPINYPTKDPPRNNQSSFDILNLLKEKIAYARSVKDVLRRRSGILLPFTTSPEIISKLLAQYHKIFIIRPPYSVLSYPPTKTGIESYYLQLMSTKYIIEPYILLLRTSSGTATIVNKSIDDDKLSNQTTTDQLDTVGEIKIKAGSVCANYPSIRTSSITKLSILLKPIVYDTILEATTLIDDLIILYNYMQSKTI